jgi:hypothetical protein
VEDQDKRTEEQEDVEGHGRKRSMLASEGAPEAEGEGEGEDVEAHGRHKPKVQASEDAPEAEGEDDDFELHKKSPKAL